MNRITSICLVLLFIAGSFLITSWAEKKPVFKNGYWRTIIQRPDKQQIIFNFETKDSGGKKIVYVVNADERLLVDSVIIREDSVFIQMPFFESGFKARIDSNGNLSGLWIKRLGDRDQVLSFQAFYNQKLRFDKVKKPLFNISGRWSVQFKGKDGSSIPSVGEFQQEGTHLTGTFLTPSGDYRYLEGVLTGDSIKLSGFDGGHAFLFTGRVDAQNHISSGFFYSGAAGVETWTAEKNDKAELPDGYDQTHLKEGETKLNFRFKSIEGKSVSLDDPVYKNKVIIIQIMGSWCPNCMDETSFLSNYYNQNRQRGVEVIALAYERTANFERSRASLQRFQKRFNVQYPMLITGATINDPLRTEKTLPQLDNIKAFPTSIFIDKKGHIRKIYSGFEGPGTGEHFIHFQMEFNETVTSLLNE